MNDVQIIANLVHAYPEALDTGDYDKLGALFEHATIRFAGSDREATGASGARALNEESVQLYDGIPRTHHVTSNLAIEIDDDGEHAVARSYWTALQAVSGFALQPILAGRWHDQFARTDGRWHFTERLVHVDLVGDASHHVPGQAGLGGAT